MAAETGMTSREFHAARRHIEKTQREMARLLGVSPKSVASYEQGWRRIPPNIERLVYFLLFKLHRDQFSPGDLCWIRQECPEAIRKNCIAWTAREGLFCWFLTGKSCVRQKSLKGPGSRTCRECAFFLQSLEKIGVIDHG